MSNHVAPGPEAHDDLDFELPDPRKVSKRRLLVIVAIVGAALLVAFLATWLPKRSARKTLVTDTENRANEVPRVEVISPKVVSSDQPVLYSGTIAALEETVIFPRVDGYVNSWLVDLGDHVESGDLLAEIDTPELDQELAQARADLAQAQAQIVQSRANREASKSAAKRTVTLTHEGVTSQQELEQRTAIAQSDEAGVGVAAANIASKQATVQRLVEQKAFARVLAPYSGIITSRTLTRGSLVAAGPTTPLFSLAAVDPVRVLVDVPQDVAPSVKTGMPAKLVVREYGSETFNGEIARSSQALAQSTRTMLVEVRVPNRDGRLLTGMSVNVSLTLPLPHRVLEVPGTAVLTDAGGVRVAVIAPNSTIKLVPIVIERDLGSTVLVSSGLDGTERIVESATGALVDGARVEPIESPPANAPPKKAGS